MFVPQQLLKIARTPMPFGRYQGCLLADLPEEYLLWFRRKDAFPEGELGQLLELALEIKLEGLQELLRPLRSSA